MNTPARLSRLTTLAPLALSALALVTTPARAALTDSLKEGKPEFRSMNQLAFGPEGILFIADAKGAAIVAVATDDTKAATSTAPIKALNIGQTLAAMTGAKAEDIVIEDLAVNPTSRQAYLAVTRGRGPDAVPLLARVKADGQVELVSLDKVKFSRADLADAPEDKSVGEGKRARNLRAESITDLAFVEGRVLVAGLSNEEFSSTLRAIPFPFTAVGRGAQIENYHGAHGQFETRAPVRTFVPYKVGGEAQVLAAYTCTPLVQFALSDLKPGAKIRGKTIAEFGNGNRPLDIIVYQKDGKDYLLMANSSRGVIKVAAEQITGAESITAKVQTTQGLQFEKLDWKGITQLDRLDSKFAVVVRSGANSAMDLDTVALP